MSTEELKCPECRAVPLKNESGRNLTICGPVLKGGTSAKRGLDVRGVERYVEKATRRAWCRKGDAGALGIPRNGAHLHPAHTLTLTLTPMPASTCRRRPYGRLQR